jgi:hypothetical protein
MKAWASLPRAIFPAGRREPQMEVSRMEGIRRGPGGGRVRWGRVREWIIFISGDGK